VRVASWIFVVCAAISAAGVFLPAVELHAGSYTAGKRGTLSLYQLNTDRDFIRRVFASYHASSRKKLGEAMIAEMMPRIGGKLHGHLDDVHSAMTSADDVTDDDIRTATIGLAVAIWAVLALQLAMAALVVHQLMRERFTGKRLIGATAIAVVVATVAIAAHIVVREAVFEANDDIGKDVVAVSYGSYMMLVAAIGAVVAGITCVVMHYRKRPA
jgi:hypothetical protein